METLQEIKQELRRYFVYVDDVLMHEPLQPLGKEQYRRFQELIDQAIALDEKDPTLWFWKGWGHHFFSDAYPWATPHGEFEYAEDAYERAIELDHNYSHAHLALTHLYWDSTIRSAAVREMQPAQTWFAQFVQEGQEVDLDEVMARVNEFARLSDSVKKRELAIDFSEAREQWYVFTSGNWFGFLANRAGYDSDLFTWMDVVDQFIGDLGLSKEELGETYYSLGYALLNAGYEEKGVLIQHAFEKTLEYSSNFQYRADGFYWLTYARVDSLDGLECFEQIVKICENPEQREYLFDDFFSAIENYADHFTGFLQASLNLRQEYPQRCLALIEKSRQLGLLDERLSGETERCIGDLYVRLGRYEDAVEYLERAQLQVVADPESLWRLAVTYAKLHRYDEAIATLDSLPEKDDRVVLLMEFGRELKDVPTLQEIASALRTRPEAPDRRMFQELIEEVTSLRSTLQGNSEETIRRIEDSIKKGLHRAPELERKVTAECMRNWPDYWPYFPEELCETVRCAEFYHQLAVEHSSTVNSPDFGPVMVAWGKVGEVAMKLAFASPFGAYLDIVEFSGELERHRRVGRGCTPAPPIQKVKGTWKDTLAGLKGEELLGLLLAAQTVDSHPARQYLEVSNLDQGIWLNRVHRQADLIRKWRNGSAHESRKFERHDAEKIRAQVISEGFLAEIGRYFAMSAS